MPPVNNSPAGLCVSQAREPRKTISARHEGETSAAVGLVAGRLEGPKLGGGEANKWLR